MSAIEQPLQILSLLLLTDSAVLAETFCISWSTDQFAVPSSMPYFDALRMPMAMHRSKAGIRISQGIFQGAVPITQSMSYKYRIEGYILKILATSEPDRKRL